ncbi:hypothetical protein ANN_02322 [Periplaneta americana]|uniref:Uncharacterized protein n=1 Tax=Periplaneta americana TaxID=6978 RepID=A0ABQ8TZE6_PERAM|nr:hypothetical protein ANN_02322 [Periplaneta americana]
MFNHLSSTSSLSFLSLPPRNNLAALDVKCKAVVIDNYLQRQELMTAIACTIVITMGTTTHVRPCSDAHVSMIQPHPSLYRISISSVSSRLCSIHDCQVKMNLMKDNLGLQTSVALYAAEIWTLQRSEEKRIEAFKMWVWRRMERVKWTEKIRNETVLERVDEERMMLKLIRKRKKNWLGSLDEKKLPTEGWTAVEGMNMGGVIVGGRRIKSIRFSDDMALLAEEEMILRDMLLKLNDSY